MASKTRVVQVPAPRAGLELGDRDVTEPPPGSVRLRIEACGICHSDSFTKEGTWPGLRYPRVPGHEIVGVIDALGDGVAGWTRGQRVGVGWHGGHCGYCASCRRGDFVTCRVAPQVPGISYDGGYAEHVVVPATVLARIPEALTPVDAAPLMCAGITTFNALRHSGARAGDTVAVLGIGGLGHLAVQFAARMGFRTVAIARGRDKEALARELGAGEYIDSAAGDPAAELVRLGGAAVILATATSAPAMAAVVGGLDVGGRLVVVGAPAEPLELSVAPLIVGRRSIVGWPSGTAIDSEETLAFSARAGVRPMTEVLPLARAAEAYDRMMSGRARFRVVLTPAG
jgi:D-arabinose 1-dehydrogenase-like Zn-dependent alcohol dehydrogenase